MKNMRRVSIKTSKESKDLTHFEGKWVAFIDSRIVDSEEDLAKLMDTVKKRYPKKEPSVLLVPRKDEGPYILIV